MKRIHRPCQHKGFTLVELLMAIVIVLILTTIMMFAIKTVREKQRTESCKVQLAVLSKAITDYANDNGGQYPNFGESPLGQNQTRELYRKLFANGKREKTRIYLDLLDPENNKFKWVQNEKIIDPWGNEYRYRPGKDAQGNPAANAVNPDFDLWSVGPDGLMSNNPSDPQNKDNIEAQ